MNREIHAAYDVNDVEEVIVAIKGTRPTKKISSWKLKTKKKLRISQ